MNNYLETLKSNISKNKTIVEGTQKLEETTFM